MLKYNISLAVLILSGLSFATSLNDLFEIALKNSNEAKVNQLTDLKTQALSDQAVGGTLPQVNFSTNVQKNWTSTKPFLEGLQGQGIPPGSIPDRLGSINYGWNLHMEQTLNVFRLGVVYDGAQKLNKASELEKQLKQESLKIQVAQAYTHLFAMREQLNLAKQIAQSTQTTAEGAQIDFNLGKLAKLRYDMILANSQVAQSDLAIAESMYAEAQDLLFLTLGQELNIDDLNSPEEIIQSFEVAPSIGDENIQVKVLEAYLDYNNSQLTYEKSMHMPDIAFLGGINNQFTHNEGLDPDLWDTPDRYIKPDYFNYYVGVRLQWAVFSGGMTSAKIKQAEIENKIQRTQMNQSKSELEIQKKQLAIQSKSLKSSMEAALTAQSTSERYYQQTVLDHKNGLVNYADLLQSERELKENTQRLTMSRSNYLLTLIQLQLLNGQSIGDAS